MSGAIRREPSLTVCSAAFASPRRSEGSMRVSNADCAEENR